ncbi:MAG: hypothetical protein KC549_02200, partial [Myxococcales bacterium]|nr:hypothetical protein [Myxococcales bacterium]
RCLADPEALPRSSIGRRGMLGLPLLARDGTPLPHPIHFPAEAQPKNTFFSMPTLDAETRDQILAAPEVPFDLAPDLMGSCGYHLASPVFCDDKLYARLVEGDEHRFQESFAWHAQKSAALAAAGYHDDQLYAFDQVAASFQELMYRRELQAGRIVAFWKAFQQGANAAVPLDVQQAIFDPSIYMHGGIAEGLRQQRGLANARMDVDQLGMFSLQAAYGDGMYVMSNDGVLPAEAFIPASAPQQLTHLALATGGPQSLDYLRHLQRGLMAIDAEIEAALHDAEALGCLDLGFANPCDWSPRHFAQRVQDLYGPERETDFRHCQENTPDGFAAIIGHDLGIQHEGERKYPAIRPTPGADLVTCFVGADATLGAAPDEDCADCNGWHHGTALVDQYFQCVEGYKALILDIVEAELGPEALNADKTLKLRGSSGELYQLGDDNFNVTLAYGFGWSLGEFEGFMDDETENHCQLKPEGYGHFDIEATALFFTQSLIHASAHARLGDGAGDDLPLPASVTPNRLEVQILDEDLFDPIDTVVDHQFNVVQDEWSEGGTLVSVQATFTIVFVPVTIKGGIAGKIGVAYGIDGEVPLEPQTGNCDVIRFTGNFSPFAQVDGFASVTIDAVIAEAGLRIDLTIIRIDLPFDVTVAISIVEGGEVVLAIQTNLDLVVSLLSGALSVYFRIVWEEYKGVIFAWDGLRFETNLLNAQLEVPLFPLRDAAIALSNM